VRSGLFIVKWSINKQINTFGTLVSHQLPEESGHKWKAGTTGKELRTRRDKNIIMGPAGRENKNNCAGPVQCSPVQTDISKWKTYFKLLRKLYTCYISKSFMIPAVDRTWGSQEFPLREWVPLSLWRDQHAAGWGVLGFLWRHTATGCLATSDVITLHWLESCASSVHNNAKQGTICSLTHNIIIEYSNTEGSPNPNG
jgi:hypothetical protein